MCRTQQRQTHKRLVHAAHQERHLKSTKAPSKEHPLVPASHPSPTLLYGLACSALMAWATLRCTPLTSTSLVTCAHALAAGCSRPGGSSGATPGRQYSRNLWTWYRRPTSDCRTTRKGERNGGTQQDEHDGMIQDKTGLTSGSIQQKGDQSGIAWQVEHVGLMHASNQ